MQKSLRRPRTIQSTLFDPPQQTPLWANLPPVVKAEVIQLIAQMLRCRQPRTGGQSDER